MRKLHLLSAAAAFATASLVCTGVARAGAPTAVNLDFNGSGNTLADTGFDAAYNLNPAGFNVGGGVLTVTTLPGDTFGQFETDPDSAQNMFYSNIAPLGMTTVEARVNVRGLNENFHGAGIWMGTDQDHYIRLGLFHNSFEGGVAVEALRENEDLWINAMPPGPGNDIVGRVIPNIAPSPQPQPIEAILRLVRDGSDVQAFVSFDDGANFQQVGGAGFNFDRFATPGDPQGNGSNTIEDLPGHPLSFKVGIYNAGGGASPATFMFDSFSAVSVPEPATAMTVVAALGALCLRQRRRGGVAGIE